MGKLYGLLMQFVVLLVVILSLRFVDECMGIKWEGYPWWKRAIHDVLYLTCGGGLFALLLNLIAS